MLLKMNFKVPCSYSTPKFYILFFRCTLGVSAQHLVEGIEKVVANMKKEDNKETEGAGEDNSNIELPKHKEQISAVSSFV